MINKEEIIKLYKILLEDYIDSLIDISKLEKELQNQKEINAEHQRINGELQKKLTKAEEIIKGKSIQELGVSKLYKDIDSITGGNPYPDFNKEVK